MPGAFPTTPQSAGGAASQASTPNTPVTPQSASGVSLASQSSSSSQSSYTTAQSSQGGSTGVTKNDLSAAQRRWGELAKRRGEVIKWTSAGVGAGIGTTAAVPAFQAATKLVHPAVAAVPLAAAGVATAATLHANAKVVQEYLAQDDNKASCFPQKKEKLYGVLGMLGGSAAGAGVGAAAGLAAGAAAPVVAAAVTAGTISMSGAGRHFASAVGKMYDDGKIGKKLDAEGAGAGGQTGTPPAPGPVANTA
ncbi:hypothetical protein HDU96_000258, partial [Phlyctochytrium bullatum]